MGGGGTQRNECTASRQWPRDELFRASADVAAMSRAARDANEIVVRVARAMR